MSSIIHTDQQLITAYRGGDKQALAELVQRYLRVAYYAAYRVVQNRADAEDVAQDAFVKMWRHLHRYDTTRPFRAWFLEIVRNTALDIVKKKLPTPVAALSEGIEERIADETVHLNTRIDATTTWTAAMTFLTYPARQVFELYYRKQYTFQEIAHTLGEPLHTVKSRYRRAVLVLRQKLAIS